MLIKKPTDIGYSEVTPKELYFNRRQILAGVPGLVLGGSGLLSPARAGADAPVKLPNLTKSAFTTTEKQTSYKDVSTYNNFYEFGTQKDDPSKNAQNFRTSPWTVSVEGEVAKPRKFSLEEILKLMPLEERIYRHRCVEGWSIVVPWIGYSLSNILKATRPTSKARFVAFQSYYDTKQMPWGRSAGIELPYVEGLAEATQVDLLRHVVHYYWLVKSDIRLPVFYGALAALLLGYRVEVWRAGGKARPSAQRQPSLAS